MIINLQIKTRLVLLVIMGLGSLNLSLAQDLNPSSTQELINRRSQHIEYLLKKYDEEFGLGEEQEKNLHNLPTAKTRGDDGEEIRITDFTEFEIEEAEPTIAVNPLNPDNIVISFIHRRNGWPIEGLGSGASSYYTFDGGETWARSNFNQDSIFFMDHPDYHPDQNPALFPRGGADPVYAFDKNGKLYCVWLYGLWNNVDEGFIIATYWGWSDDGGINFKVAEEKEDRLLGFGSFLDSGITGTIVDRPWLAVDKSDGPFSGSVYVQASVISYDKETIYGEYFFGSALIRKSADNNFFRSNEIPMNDWLLNSEEDLQVTFANLHVDNQGAVHSSFSTLDAGAPVDAFHLLSTDGGLTFEASSAAAASPITGRGGTIARENPMPDAVTHPESGNIYLTYTTGDENGHFGKLVKSTDQGNTWSEPQDIATIINANVTGMLFTTIAMDEISGRMSIGYMGRDAANSWNYYVTSSIDEGVSWDKPCRLSNTHTDFEPYYSNPVFFGDYWETKMVGDKSYCVWTDGRNNNGAKIYVGIVDHNESVGVVESGPLTDLIEVLSVSPNPTYGEVLLKLESQQNSDLHINLLGTNGQVHAELFDGKIQSGQQEFKVDFPDSISDGTYILSIKTDYGTFSRIVILLDD